MSGLLTSVDGDDVVVRYADPEHRAEQVSVWAHLQLGDTTMARVEGGWEVRLSDLPVDRLEYLVDVDGSLRPDPGNPHVVPGPFGDHSWVALPGYRPPAWLDLEPVAAERAPLTLSRSAVGRIDAEIWSPADASADEHLPLLISHDGPEMDAYGALTTYVGALMGAGRLPRMRVALVARRPAQPAVRRQPGVRPGALCPAGPRAGGGGADRGTAGADGSESRCARGAARVVDGSGHCSPGCSCRAAPTSPPTSTRRSRASSSGTTVTGFVASVHAAEQAAPDAPVTTLTCGTAEENHANNLAMRDHLARVGVETGGARRATATPGPAGATPSTPT